MRLTRIYNKNTAASHGAVRRMFTIKFDKEKQMKIKQGFLLRRIADVHVVAPVKGGSVDFNGIITLNETAAFLFEQLQQETTREALLERMTSEYEVDREKALSDIDTFFSQLEEANLLA